MKNPLRNFIPSESRRSALLTALVMSFWSLDKDKEKDKGLFSFLPDTKKKDPYTKVIEVDWPKPPKITCGPNSHLQNCSCPVFPPPGMKYQPPPQPGFWDYATGEQNHSLFYQSGKWVPK